MQTFDPEQKKFIFHKGPIFSNIIFADELNRASPKTQSALLEAMGESVVTIDRKTHSLDKPFFVIAAQNPSDHLGTFPIPESQLDRFAIKVKLDYPHFEKEMKIFSESKHNPLDEIPADLISQDELLAIQDQVDHVHASEDISRCVKSVVDASRHHNSIELGISTRGGVQWVRLAKGLAVLDGRSYVIPDDLINIATFCLSHRIIIRSQTPSMIIDDILQHMDI